MAVRHIPNFPSVLRHNEMRFCCKRASQEL
jgi:hypothetical protein